MRLTNIFICVSLTLCIQFEESKAESITFISTERPQVTYLNYLFLKYGVMNSRRKSNDRKDPRHYINIYFESLVPLDNNIRVNIYFYQFLTNRYRPSFIELHYSLCDLIEKDPIIGAQLKRKAQEMNLTCPFSPGQYNLTNMVISFVPKNFPFSRGRIYANLTITINGISTPLLRTHIDMEIQKVSIRKK